MHCELPEYFYSTRLQTLLIAKRNAQTLCRLYEIR